MKKAFTLVETLVVIAVFWTGILVVLIGIVQTLGNQDKAKTQITSSFLAREGIELMYNLRDSNYRKKLDRDCLFQPQNADIFLENIDDNPFCPEKFWSGTVLKLSMDLEGHVKVESWTLSESFEENFSAFQLYYLTGEDIPFQFIHSSGEESEENALWYARYILIKPVLEKIDGNEEVSIVPKERILKIESHVLYQKGGLTGDRVMESFIGNYRI